MQQKNLKPVDFSHNKSASKYCACYYLVYKLQTHPTMWIVKVDDNKHNLFGNIDKFRSKTEKYYIIKKYVSNIENELKTKRFTIFNKTSDCYILSQTHEL